MTDGTLRREHRFSVVPEHFIRDARVSDRAFRLWCILDRYAGANETAFPLRERLAGDLQCSVATLDRALVELVKYGWLSKARRYSGGPNDYTLLVSSESTPVLTGDATGKEASGKEAAGKESPRSARGTRLPDDWWPDEHLRAWFAAQEFHDWINPRVETENFRDYWRSKAGKDAVKIDWNLTWQTWMRRAAQRLGYGKGAVDPLGNRHAAIDTGTIAADLDGRRG